MNIRHSSRPRRIAFAVALTASLLTLTACAPKYYSSNSQSVPLFTDKGQAAVSAAVNPELHRAEARGALAVSDRVAVQGNAALYFPPDEENGNGGKGGLIEGGAGIFLPLTPNIVYETWGLLAYGGVENRFPGSVDDNPGTDGRLNANLMRVALQPAIGYKMPWFEAAASARVAMLNYFKVRGNLVTSEGDQQDYLRDHSQQFLVEPAITLRAGWPQVKAEAQLGFSVNMGDGGFPQDDNWASLGVVYFFDPSRRWDGDGDFRGRAEAPARVRAQRTRVGAAFPRAVLSDPERVPAASGGVFPCVSPHTPSPIPHPQTPLFRAAFPGPFIGLI